MDSRGVRVYQSISVGGRFHTLAIVSYELFEVPTQLYSLSVNAQEKALHNIIIFLGLVNIHQLDSNADAFGDGCQCAHALVMDTFGWILFQGQYCSDWSRADRCLVTWQFGCSIMLASMVLSLFQVRKLKKVEWVENPEMEDRNPDAG